MSSSEHLLKACEAVNVASDRRWILALRIAASPHFSKSEQLKKLLLYVVDRALHGAIDEINEHEIGCRVFGRQPGFNRSEDSIVRVQARQLRRKLESYFAEEGRGEPLVIRIRPGSYVPLFEPAVTSAAEVRPDLPVAAVKSACKSNRFLLTSLIVLLLVDAAASGYILVGLRRKPAPPLNREFWSQILNATHHTQIVVGDACAHDWQAANGHTVGVDEYISQWVGHPRSALPLTGGFGACQTSSFGDLNIAGTLLKLNQAFGGLVSVRFARDLQVRDFEVDNFVLLGGPRSNPWVHLFEQNLNYVRGFDPTRPGSYFQNRSPKKGEQPYYTGMGGAQFGDEYGSAALLPNLSGTGVVLLVQGSSMSGMEAAANFLMQPHSEDAIRTSLGARKGPLPFFEILLRTINSAGATRDTQLIGVRRHSPSPTP